jgi:hypothetical protein
MNSESPARFDHLAALLAAEEGRPAPATMLLIALEGIDVIESQIPQLAAAGGVSGPQLETLVAMAPQALDDQSPRVPGQHVVSKVLLPEFCEDQPEGRGCSAPT